MFDVNDVLRALKRAVEDYGYDWVDPNSGGKSGGCVYNYESDGQTKHCIAGHVLDQFGLEVTEDTNKSTKLDDVCIKKGGGKRVPIQYHMTEEAIKVLLKAQSAQDREVPWGDAYQRAESFARLKNLLPTK